MNPFKEENCPNCNKHVKKLNHNTMSTKEIYFCCHDCEINMDLQQESNASGSRYFCISLGKMHFYLFEDNKIIISRNSERGISYNREFVIDKTFMDLSDIKSVKEAYNFCLKVRDNLLFL